jgi:hypothetical protein
MPLENHDCLVELASLTWPVALHIPKVRFRLFMAVDTTGCPPDVLAEFAHAALKSGMVYFCAWGPDCERFHDIVDEVIVEDAVGKRLFVGPNANDTVMTTWHANDTLEEALDYFLLFSCPTEGFLANSDYWLAMCVNNPAWAAIVEKRLEHVGPSRLG